MLNHLKQWTPAQRHVVFASFLGWMLDAFDFFLLVFVLKDVAHALGSTIEATSFAIMLTLGLRPVGAFIFGRLADRFGRRPILMMDVALYAILGFATAFSPNITVFFILRALFGVAMGGEWGIGASLTMESVPQASRGFVSGLLQSGYPCGYLLASVVFAVLYPYIGWRGMFMVGIIPALLVLYIRRSVPESPGWSRKEAEKTSTFKVFADNWKLAVFTIVLMMGFNFLSHGTQDLYPTFMQVQRAFSHEAISTIAIIYNIGAIMGGIFFGQLSQKYGRRRMMIVSAFLAIVVAPLWSLPHSAVLLGAGAFLMQFFVQGCWGIVPAHLNEISPPSARGTFPGTMYQLGNFIASANAPLQVAVAGYFGGQYSIALALTASYAAVIVIVMAALSRTEARDAQLAMN